MVLPSDQQRAPGRPRKEEATALPSRIIDAAQELLLSQGFERTTLNQIAASAGVTKRTVYVKVGDKADLLRAVVDRVLTDGPGSLVDQGTDVSLRDRLIRFGDSLLVAGLDWNVLRLYRLAIAESATFPELAVLLQERVLRGGQHHLAVMLHDEVRNGRIRLVDPDASARLLIALVLGEPQREALLGLEGWSPQVCHDWVVGAIGLFLDDHRI